VRSAIESAVKRIINEFSVDPMAVGYQTTPTSSADELKKLAELKDRGVLTADEFEAQKRKLLQS
jgi:hypothetical protein